jgi:hypothetical protein
MAAQSSQRLKLRARDSADFRVLSAVLQDALAPLRDMARLAQDKRFVLLANRFRWEARASLADLPDQPAPEPATDRPTGGDARFEDAPLYERVQCGVTFDRVAEVQYRGFARDDPGRVLSLLALLPDRGGVTLQFADDAAIRLQGKRLVCHLEDLGEPWPTHWRPSHAPSGRETHDAPPPASPSEDP